MCAAGFHSMSGPLAEWAPRCKRFSSVTSMFENDGLRSTCCLGTIGFLRIRFSGVYSKESTTSHQRGQISLSWHPSRASLALQLKVSGQQHV